MKKTLFLISIVSIYTASYANPMIDSLKAHIKNKETDKLIGLLSEHPEVIDETDENGSSGLLIIAYSGIHDAFEKAIELKKSFTFHEAIVCGKILAVKAFIMKDSGIVNAYSPDGFTPLSLAAFFNQTEIAELLLQHGGDPGLSASNASKVNALHSAVAKENYKLCQLFVDRVDVNAAQMQNVTALHSAAHRGNLQLVKLLVENGATIDLKMDNGETALSIAEKDNHKEVRDYLKKALENKK